MNGPPTPPPSAALATRQEAAAFLRISPRKLDALTASGAIPRVRIGAAVRFDRDDLEAFIASCKTR